MSMQDCFSKLFREAQGEDPDQILQTIRTNRLTQYHVESKGYSQAVLQSFIAELNCAIVFSSDDGFDTNFRLDFIDNLPVSASKKAVVFVDSNFSQVELIRYAARAASIHICDRSSSLGNLFKLISFSKRFPGLVSFRSKAFTKPQIDHMLPLTDIRVSVLKGDFEDVDINSFIDVAGTNIEIDRNGFNDDEITSFKDRGASIIRERVV